MKTLFITPRFNEHSGGDGLYAFHLAHALVYHGMEVSVLHIREGIFVLSEIGPDKFSREDCILGRVGRGVVGVNYYSSNARKAVEEAVRYVEPGVLHIHGIHQYFTLSSIRVLKQKKIPCVLTVHDYKILCGNAGFYSDHTHESCFRCLTGRVFPPVVEKCKRNSRIKSLGAAMQMAFWNRSRSLDVVDMFHCGSEFVLRLLEQNAEVQNKLRKVRMPILRNIVSADAASRDLAVNIVYIGRMVPHKGVLIFAEAVRSIRSIKIDLFGDGPDLDKARRMLESNPNVEFHGWKHHDEMEKYLTSNTIVVVPYLAPETFCYVVLEAMMRGCCVIASGSGAIPELIQDGVNGLVVDPADATHFRESITSLLQDRKRRELLARNARSISESVDNLEEHSRKIITMYESIVQLRQISSGEVK